ncbi:tetratricopeptide repeat protein [Actinoallomurus vinaceus]|uniref:Tetratricopeptide repeat protein n=1 Tax=Actinoallomurus vinaceus TaxID=1080074 RepID=A0ABP8U1A1_9ACTN
MRRLLTAGIIVAVAGGLTLGSAAAFDRRFEPATTPAAAAGPDRISTADLTADVAQLQRHLRTQPRDAAGWATLGLAYVEQARLTADPSYYPKAEGVLRRSLQESPRRNAAALAGLGALAAARHDFAGALRYADASLAVDPYGTRANGVRIDALVELGRYPEALAAARRADSLRPGIPIFTRLAYVQELRGRSGEARRILLGVSATDPGDTAYVETQLGELAWNSGDRREAGRRFAAALRADASYLPALDGRARVRAAEGDTAGAVRDLRDVVARLPLPSYVIGLGELYESLGRGDEARRQYAVARTWERLAAADGVSTDLETALFAADHGDPAEALRAARAEWGRRRSLHVADALAWALHVSGRDREALGYAEQATRTGYRNALFRYHRGMIEKALGRRADARRDLAAALHLNPWFSPLQAPRARAALEAL